MTTPAQPDRPANTRLRALTTALIGAAGVVALAIAIARPAVRHVSLCTIGDTAQPQLVAAVLGINGVPTDTLIPADSALFAHLDSAEQGALFITAPCEFLDRDTTAAHRAELASHDSLIAADSAKWVRGDTTSLSTDRDFWHVVLGDPGTAPP